MMATIHDAAPPRKKIATYGKTVRRRIPEFTFASTVRKSQIPEVQKREESRPSTSASLPATPAKLKSVLRRSVSRTPSVASPPPDIFNTTLSDEDVPKEIHKTTSTPSKLKSIRTRSVSRTPAPASPVSANVFDVPASEDEAPKLKPTPKPVKILPTKNAGVKAIRQKVASSTSLRATQPGTDIFDVSRDEEAGTFRPKPSHKLFQKMAAVHNVQGKSTVKTATDIAEEVGSRKRLKLSPAHEPPSPRRLPANTMVRPPKSRASSKPPKHRNTSPMTGQFTKITARPKLEAPLKWPVRPSTPKKLSPAPKPSSPSPQLSDVDMMDADPVGDHISPKGMKMWQALLHPAEDTEMIGQEPIPDIIRDQAGRKDTLNLLSRPAGVVKASQRSPRKLPRRRLIDCLVEQAAEESEEDSSADDDTELSIDSAPSSSPAIIQTASRSQSAVPELAPLASVVSDSQASQGPGPKFTYSKQRSMLAEADLMQQLALEMPIPPAEPTQGRRARMVSVPALKPLTSFQEEQEEDGAAAAVRSIHELRKSGANNRFLDEVQDFLERIGSPGTTSVSMRRSGLLDLGNKMKDKSFAEKFRANGMEQKLFLHLGQETDLVAGFVMVSLLMSVLIDGNMPHIVAQLRRQGITRLLIRLLECQSSIASVAKDRKSNMSKVAQSLFIEHCDYIMQMPTWEDLKPQVISPRTIALKCLEVMVRQTREAGNSGDIFSKELTTNLFGIMNSASDEHSWDLPKDKQAIDFYLALSALESHSITARTVHDETIWINDFLPIIANTLGIALSRPVDDFGMLQVLLLRLTLNVTNNNSRASDVFARPSLMSSMGKVIVAKFKQISRFLTEEELDVAVEHLILALGVMINFAEWSSVARESMQSLEGGNDDPLDAMVQTFADNQERTSQVRDSMLHDQVRLTLTIIRRTRGRRVKRTLRLAIFLFYSDTCPSCHLFRRGYKAGNQGRRFAL